MQQHLPFTVLKPQRPIRYHSRKYLVATAPTVYGIETPLSIMNCIAASLLVATAPTVYGIETCE